MKPTTKKILQIVILLILVALAINYLINNISEFLDLSLVSPHLIIVLIIIILISLLVTGMNNAELLKLQGLNLKIKEIFQLAVITRFYNFITPFRGGMAARAVYLKKKYKFPYADFLATLSASYILIFLVASALGILSTFLIYLSTGTFSLIIFLIFNSVFIGMLSIIILSPKLKDGGNKWVNRFIRVVNGWHLIKDNRKSILSVVILSLIQILLGSLMLWLQFKIFGFDIPFTACVFLAAIGNLGMVLAVTPAGLGINEAIIVFSALTIGITPSQSLSVVLLGRLIQMLVLFILGPIFSYLLIKKPRVKI